jgi:hypothetical protein
MAPPRALQSMQMSDKTPPDKTPFALPPPREPLKPAPVSLPAPSQVPRATPTGIRPAGKQGRARRVSRLAAALRRRLTRNGRWQSAH